MPKVKKKGKKAKKKGKKAEKKRATLNFAAARDEDAATPPIHIENVVSTFKIGVESLDLKLVATRFEFLNYVPSRFAASTMRLADPKTTALLFSSGNVVLTGAKTPLLSRLAARKYVGILRNAGLNVAMRDFKVQNIVATTHIDAPMRLREFADEYGAYTSYEPDLFPGLVFRTVAPKVVFLVFRSGKIVITGSRRREDVERVFKAFFHTILRQFVDEVQTDRCSANYRKQYARSLGDARQYI
jgi:transcription initiation factor TFIID TATA-box-binding protein|tara:strand:+ start:127 stop:855 length:729 start_codon:yes stop_codon:yes gene_type:complete